MRPARSLIALLILCCSLLPLDGCAFSGDIAGPNGYAVSCDKGRDCVVTCDHGSVTVVVGPEVDQYAIVGGYLVGHSTKQYTTYPPGLSPLAVEASGYFVINTETDQCTTGLDEAQWREHLARLNIQVSELRATAYDPSHNHS